MDRKTCNHCINTCIRSQSYNFGRATAGQDFYHYTEMMEFLSKLNQQGKTIIMITHDMHLLVEYTERTIVVSEGQI